MARMCSICREPITGWTGFTSCSDGLICSRCYKDLGYSFNNKEIRQMKHMTVREVATKAPRRINTTAIAVNFTPTTEPAPYAKFDDRNKTMLLSPKTHRFYKPQHYTWFSYDQLIDFELLENGATVASGGLGRALVGGLLFGGVGAIVGGVTGTKKNICEELKIKLTVTGYSRPAFYITIIDEPVPMNSVLYKKAMEQAQDVMSQLQLATTMIQKMPAQVPAPSSTGSNSTDVLREYKSLLDDGIITQEEYDQKKASVLSGGNRCPSCGQTISRAGNFCSFCGAKLTRNCPNCGAPDQQGNFCMKCGCKLISER